METTSLVIEKIVQENETCKSFQLRSADGKPLHYAPGQFVHFSFETKHGTTFRSYSFSSIPGESETITVKRIPNGSVSRLLFLKKKGDTLDMVNIGGKFVLPEQMQDIKQVFFFAAGSGISPIFSLIKQTLLDHPNLKISLCYSNKSEASTVFKEELDQLMETHADRFTILYINSDNPNILEARLSGFRLQSIINTQKKFDWKEILVYTCGPIDYMDTVKITLYTMGVKPEHFFVEIFDQVDDSVMTPPPDTKERKVHFKLKNETKTITVQYPDTILTAALNAGLNIPYSCQSGQCGSCTAHILEGKVWLQYNEVLTPKEIESGLTLTCMGCPIEGDVKLTYD